jgi:leucyl aminopeptidase
LQKLKNYVTVIEIISAKKQHISTAVLFQNFEFLKNDPEIDGRYLEEKLSKETEWTIFKQPLVYFFHQSKEGKEQSIKTEAARRAGSKFYDVLKNEKSPPCK